jgi:hypothetical protein
MCSILTRFIYRISSIASSADIVPLSLMMIVPSPCISTVVGIANRRGSFTTLSSNCTYGRSRIIQAGTDEDDNDNDDDDDEDDDDYFDDDDDEEEDDYFGTCDALH